MFSSTTPSVIVDLLEDDEEDSPVTHIPRRMTTTTSSSSLSQLPPSCAYAKAWAEVLQFALRPSHRHLWTTSEQLLLQQIESLSFHALRLFGRLLLRKAAWVKTESLLKYVKNYGEDLSEGQGQLLQIRLQQAIQELLSLQLLQTIRVDSNFEECWEVATMILTMEDWQVFHKRFLSVKLPPRSNNSSKEDMLATIKKMILTQRTCFGTTVKDQFVKSLVKFWKEKDTTLDPPVQIPPHVMLFMRRLVRFFHVS